MGEANTLEGKTIRGYQLKNLVGSGGFGQVYRALQLSIDREVAIKVIHPEFADHPDFVARFDAEARTIARLEHPHIVPLYDFWRDDEGAFLVMRYIKGGSLREQLHKSGPLPVARVKEILEQVCSAVQAAHGQEVIHRDLKPENILLDERGETYLTDFGIAKNLAGESLTQPGGFLGSAAYIAPEQAKGQDVDARTDIYLAGVLLYELLTGNHPFENSTPIQLIQKHLNESVPPLSGIDAELARALDLVIKRATAKDKADRYASVGELIRDLSMATSGELRPYLRRGAKAEAHHLPSVLTSFVGRQTEIQRLEALLLNPDARLITILGPGGVGKTRLAIELANRQLHRFPDGVWFIDLAAIAEAAEVPRVAALALGVHEQPDRPLSDVIVDALLQREALIIFDNCEHLVAAVSSLSERLLTHSKRMKVLATSRQALRIAGETAFSLGPLPIHSGSLAPHDGAIADAVKLFGDRAMRANSEFSLNDANLGPITELCKRLDGLPLAIELAAARARALSPAEILERLDERFSLLASGTGMRDPRQETLLGSVRWSYDLLSEDERRVFDRLSVFRTGATLDAMEYVCSRDEGASRPVLVALSDLVDKSLVVAEQRPGAQTRYRQLDTLREFGRSRLLERDEWHAVSRQHADYYVQLAARAGPEAWGAGNLEWNRRLLPEIQEIVAAVDWSLANGKPGWVVDIVTQLLYFVHHRGLSLNHLRTALQSALAQTSDLADELLAKGLWAAGYLEWVSDSDADLAERLSRRCIELSRSIGDREYEVLARINLAKVLVMKGDLQLARLESEAAQDLAPSAGWYAQFDLLFALTATSSDASERYGIMEAAVAMAKESRNATYIAFSTIWLADAALDLGQYALAKRLFTESDQLLRELGSSYAEYLQAMGLGIIAGETGHYEEAVDLTGRAIAAMLDSGDIRAAASNTRTLARNYRGLGDLDSSERVLEQGLALLARSPWPPIEGWLRVNQAASAQVRGDLSKAARLCEQAIALWREVPRPGPMALGKLQLADIFRLLGDTQKAMELFCAAVAMILPMMRDLPLAQQIWSASLAAVFAMAASKFELGAFVCGAVEHQMEWSGFVLWPPERDEYGEAVRSLETAIEDRATSSSFAAGKQASLTEALERTLGELCGDGTAAPPNDRTEEVDTSGP